MAWFTEKPPGPATREPSDSTQDLRREIKEFVKMIAWFLVLFVTLKAYVIEGYKVQGDSMSPTLENSERILVFKLPQVLSQWGWLGGSGATKPGDVVVFKTPEDTAKRYVKRLIAKGRSVGHLGKTAGAQPQDEQSTLAPVVRVRIAEGKVYVNNQRIAEDYLPPNAMDETEWREEILLAPGEVYVLGDNRKISRDSRIFRAVREELIVGKAVFRFWPLHRFGLVR